MEIGFYKLEGADLLYSPSKITGPNYTLDVALYNTYTYPVNGWRYFASLQEACNFYGLNYNNIIGRDEKTALELSLAQTKESANHLTKDLALAGSFNEEQYKDLVLVNPPYKVGFSYSVNDVFSYNSQLYKVVQAHVSQDDWIPSSLPALYTKIPPPGTVAPWVQPTGAQDAYQLGDRVLFNALVWESTVNNNVWQPGVFGWIQV